MAKLSTDRRTQLAHRSSDGMYVTLPSTTKTGASPRSPR